MTFNQDIRRQPDNDIRLFERIEDIFFNDKNYWSPLGLEDFEIIGNKYENPELLKR